MIFIMSCGSFCFLLPFLAALLVAGDEGKVEGPVIGFLAKVATDIANVEHERGKPFGKEQVAENGHSSFQGCKMELSNQFLTYTILVNPRSST